LFDAKGVRIKVALPGGWIVSKFTKPGSLVALDLEAGLRMEIVETAESSMVLDAAVSAES
jgi:hypothetical protein